MIELSLRKRAALILLIVPTFEMIANYPSTYYYVMLGGSLLMFLLAFILSKVRAAPCRRTYRTPRDFLHLVLFLAPRVTIGTPYSFLCSPRDDVARTPHVASDAPRASAHMCRSST